MLRSRWKFWMRRCGGAGRVRPEGRRAEALRSGEETTKKTREPKNKNAHQIWRALDFGALRENLAQVVFSARGNSRSPERGSELSELNEQQAQLPLELVVTGHFRVLNNEALSKLRPTSSLFRAQSSLVEPFIFCERILKSLRRK